MANMELEMNTEQQMAQRSSAMLIMFASLLTISSLELEHTLSGYEIANCLATVGHPLARRTVNKYRKQLGILSSKLR